ncbi:type II secretion system minor pseudopilin GspI [Sulfitobacter mediterraneus]|uniref:type II secretion system minor pseudopilin GspI n=1 Tax=Sulfitobacter mediterraneus TaxID=83219 RepID=UPI0019327821|nr:type II secretion system minor pseudopilin GspI [Sulfitobacter mediterraneus]MBM1635199.1 type II secretion system minor pseudopilin GspI [Sulfitobacter mediterraneus]MBM1643050.1 type II secretion system minor pseudopilin GspI [Sulfitobacter mediterraneus]MBM1647098.1 type II secretion system minor pseudopilin GspI [Sulfitobacter mediterraneus]MBM1651140.1 type II secretion system minor pseudopilin GspI [Sulfitobacter mediterraneus]MBM1655133.1 type II secretion system minor pseudopilin Gs
MIDTRQPDAGFTLIETLVALTVLAVGSMTLLTAVERHARASGQLADRIVARWVAENALAATSLGLDVAPRWRSAMGVDWAVRIEARALPETGLSAVTLRVADAAQGPDAELVSLTGYTALTGGSQ